MRGNMHYVHFFYVIAFFVLHIGHYVFHRNDLSYAYTSLNNHILAQASRFRPALKGSDPQIAMGLEVRKGYRRSSPLWFSKTTFTYLHLCRCMEFLLSHACLSLLMSSISFVFQFGCAFMIYDCFDSLPDSLMSWTQRNHEWFRPCSFVNIFKSCLQFEMHIIAAQIPVSMFLLLDLAIRRPLTRRAEIQVAHPMIFGIVCIM